MALLLKVFLPLSITWLGPTQLARPNLQLPEEHNNVPAKYFKKLVNTDDIWEVRISLGSNIFRLLCFFDGDAVIVLTHAFQKKTQKTPMQAITTAEKRMKDYFRRKVHE